MQIEWWRLVLLMVLFGGLFGAWWWSNRGKFNWQTLTKKTESKIKVLERLWVSHQLTLFLIEVGSEKFLLARTPGSLSWQKLENLESDSKKDS